MAVPLVRQEGEHLVLCDEGIEMLRSLGQAKVATVSIAGQYRTGKSFVLNRIVGGSSSVSSFKVGSTTESCTRGIWMWPVPPEAWSGEDGPDSRLVLFDTEGLASMDNDETYDCKVFSLAILLSSFFVYNSVGVIDEAAIDRLFLVAELTRSISISARQQTQAAGEPGNADEMTAATELAECFPPFMWLLRDFSLSMEQNGRPITPKEYLETALEDRPGNSSRVADRNRIRRLFKKLFRDRACATLVRPVYEEKDLRILTTLPQERLRADFVSQLGDVTKSVLGRARVKRLFGEGITGAMLASLAASYIEAINGGAVPSIRKSYEYVVEESLRAAYEEAAAAHECGLAVIIRGEGAAAQSDPSPPPPPASLLPTRAEFDVAEEQLRKCAVDRFLAGGGRAGLAGGGGDGEPASEVALTWRAKLEERLRAQRAAALGKLCEASAARCAARGAELLRNSVRGPLEAGAFDPVHGPTDAAGVEAGEVAGGSEACDVFAKALESFCVAYEDSASGPSKWECLSHLLRVEGMAAFGTHARRVQGAHVAAAGVAAAALRAERTQRERVEELLATREAELDETRTALDGLQERHTELEGVAAELRSSLRDEERRAENAERDASAKAGEISRLEGACSEVRAQLAEREVSLTAALADAKEERGAHAATRTRLAESEGETRLEAARRKDTESTLREREATIEKMGAEATVINEDLRKAVAATESVETALSTVREELSSAQRRGDALGIELDAERAARAADGARAAEPVGFSYTFVCKI